MFDKLKKAFSSAARSIGQKEITEKVLDQTLMDLQLELLESDVAQEVVDGLAGRLKKELLGLKLEKGEEPGQVIEAKLKEAVAGVFARAGRLDLVDRIRAKKEAKQGPFVIVFLGINGTGKTTTVAKMGNLLRRSGISVVVAAGDTHRAGAIEQLSQHAERLSLKVIAQRYGADPSAVGRDAVDYAKKHYVDAVLIDTAGRMQTSKNLMDEMAKIVRVVRPDAKIFVGDSLAGNDTINQAREFFQYTNFDGAILTKIDADAKGGSAISIAHITSKPIAYVGVGQGYDDMIPFDPDKFIESLFGSSAAVSVQDLMSASAARQPPSEGLQPAPAGEEGGQGVPAPVEATGQEKEEKPAALPPAAVSAPASPAASPLFRPASAPAPAPAKEPEKPAAASIPQEGSREPAPAPAQKPSSPHPLPPSPPTHEPEPARGEAPQKEEKKSRFGFFGRKKDKDDEDRRRKEEEEEKEKEKEQKRREQERREEQEKEERQRREKEQKEKEKEKDKDKKKSKEDNEDAGANKKDEVVYLTDEDIEDLLK